MRQRSRAFLRRGALARTHTVYGDIYGGESEIR